MTKLKRAPSKKHSSGLYSFNREMFENDYFLTAFPEALWVTADTQALREEETGEKRCKSICLQNSFNF